MIAGDSWSYASWFFQLLAIGSASAFGVLAVISKRRKGALSKPDKFLVTGSVVAGLVGIAVLVTTIVTDQNQEKKADSTAKQGQQRLLHESERQEFQISNYGAFISYEVSASDPVLVPAVSQWKNYLASLSPTPNVGDIDFFTGPDSNVSLIRDDNFKVTEMRILTNSKLFPTISPEEADRFFPILFVRVLQLDAADPTHYTDQPATLLFPREDEDLSFDFISNHMLRTDQATNSAETPIVQGYLAYHPKDGTVEVFAKINTMNHLRTYKGAITSLIDLPGRVLEVDVVSRTPLIRINRVGFLTQVGHLDDRGGTAIIEAKDLTVIKGSGGLMVTHKLTRDDFPLLAHTDEPDSSKPSH